MNQGIHTSTQLGQQLRSARKSMKLTQPQLALAAGVGVRFIVDLEAGKPTVRLAHVLRVIEAMGGVMDLRGLPSSSTSTSTSAANDTGATHAA